MVKDGFSATYTGKVIRVYILFLVGAKTGVKMVIEKLSLTCDGLLSHRQLACCPSYCGIPLHGKDMLVYGNVDAVQKVR